MLFIRNNKYGFTLVELIVVIVILVILGTISFISFKNYSAQTRDSKRLSDIQNIKKSLELFSINTGKYPKPDSGTGVFYNTGLLWTQGTIGDTVFTNLSRNLNKKPIDPLYEVEYIYSVTYNETEYELMLLLESDIISNLLINNKTYAEKKYKVKIEGNYNQLFVMTPIYLFPTPSIMFSINQSIDLANSGAINLMVVTNGDNLPDLGISRLITTTGSLDLKLSSYKPVNLNSSDSDKIMAIEKIQETFSGSVLQNEILYKMLLSKKKNKDKLQLADWIFGGNFEGTRLVSGDEENPDTEVPILSLLGPSGEIGTSPVTLTVTTNENAICKYDLTETSYNLMTNTFDISGNIYHASSFSGGLVEGENNLNVICTDLSNNESELGNISFIYTPSTPVNITFSENDNEVYICDLCD